jgi:hypothetical protein
MRCNSAGSPSVVLRCSALTRGITFVGRTAATERGGSSPRKWWRPTAMEWAQMVPHSRTARHVQTFSTSTSLLMTNPARYEVEPSWTTPLRSGGDQLELSTLSPASRARACFIASHPAIFAKNCSERTTAILKLAAYGASRGHPVQVVRRSRRRISRNHKCASLAGCYEE